MKIWLGVIGRACVEFAIILVLVSFIAGAGQSLGMPLGDFRSILEASVSAALVLAPLAALLTLFLAFFSFELRVRSRILGWLGLLILAALLFSVGLGLRSLPALREAAALSSRGTRTLRLIPPGTALQQGRAALWVSSYEGGEALGTLGVDFSSDYPRLAYSPRSEIDASSGEIDIQGRTYRAALPEAGSKDIVPEASLFAGAWIWDRLATQEALIPAFAAAGGFLLLAIGFRFLCRLSGWPLANALLAAAGLAGLVVLDAALSGSPILGSVEALIARLGLKLRGPYVATFLLASIEALIGLILGAADLAAAPSARRLSDD